MGELQKERGIRLTVISMALSTYWSLILVEHSVELSSTFVTIQQSQIHVASKGQSFYNSFAHLFTEATSSITVVNTKPCTADARCSEGSFTSGLQNLYMLPVKP